MGSLRGEMAETDDVAAGQHAAIDGMNVDEPVLRSPSCTLALSLLCFLFKLSSPRLSYPPILHFPFSRLVLCRFSVCPRLLAKRVAC